MKLVICTINNKISVDIKTSANAKFAANGISPNLHFLGKKLVFCKNMKKTT